MKAGGSIKHAVYRDPAAKKLPRSEEPMIIEQPLKVGYKKRELWKDSNAEVNFVISLPRLLI